MKSYQVITDRIVSLLEEGTVPWHKPWKGGPAGHPRSLSTGKPYRGINIFMLHAAGYSSPHWLTFKHAQAMGGHVCKGEKGWPVVFWKWIDRRASDQDEGADQGKRKGGQVPLLRYFTVFNVEQCEGLGIEAPAPPDGVLDFQPIDQAERIAAAMPDPPTIRNGEARAYYRRSSDTVNMPRQELFTSGEEYYSTLFHELTHATGHERRLNRQGVADQATFGSTCYGREELVAEMGAAFLCGQTGIEQTTIENSAAYLAGWLKTIKADARLVVTAAAQAQKAADYVLNVKHDEA